MAAFFLVVHVQREAFAFSRLWTRWLGKCELAKTTAGKDPFRHRQLPCSMIVSSTPMCAWRKRFHVDTASPQLVDYVSANAIVLYDAEIGAPKLPAELVVGYGPVSPDAPDGDGHGERSSDSVGRKHLPRPMLNRRRGDKYCSSPSQH